MFDNAYAGHKRYSFLDHKVLEISMNNMPY